MTASLNNSEPAIRIDRLTKRFGSLAAVDGFSLEVAQGEAFALVGPDGAGKTTTMRLLVGVMDPDGGRAEVLGYDTVQDAERLKEDIGYMPQRFGLYDDLTVLENLTFYADVYGVAKAARQTRLPELLGFSNLTPFQDRLAGDLSGGMRQKLGLACALIHTPRVLFLDEPTFGVDPVSRREFWQILHQLLAGGMTIFVTTAYMDEAERAHRVGLMHRGRLLAADDMATLKARFQGELLEVRADDLPAAKKILADFPLARHLLVMGDRLMVTVDSQVQAQLPIQQGLEGAGLTQVSVAQAEPGLEDLFAQMVSDSNQQP